MFKKLALPSLTLAAMMVLAPTISQADEEYRPPVIPELEIIEDIPTEKDSNVRLIESGESTVAPSIYDPGGWQSRGQYGGSIYTGTNYTAIPGGSGINWISGGGDFKVEITGVQSANSYTVRLMEYDPDDNGYNQDEEVFEGRATGNATIVAENIDGRLDGGNNEAEFYILISQAYTDEYVYAEGFD